MPAKRESNCDIFALEFVFVSSVGSPILWIGFGTLVLALLALDLGVFHRSQRKLGLREALLWSAAWIALAIFFNGWIYWRFGAEPGLQFLTGYLIEKALSLDNVFVFAIVFSYFAIREEHQHRVLFWGVLGALVMRAVFVALGSALVSSFHWVLYVFGAVLAITGAKLLFQRDEKFDPERSWLVRGFKRFVPMTSDSGGHFVVRKGGGWFATPLLLVLFVVEATDLLFAIDSIPAIFAVTTDPFLVFTSNVFAILGMRSLYFALAGLLLRLKYLKIGLAAVLVFIGAKMMLAGVYKVPVIATLIAVVVILGGAALASIWKTRASTPVGMEAAR